MTRKLLISLFLIVILLIPLVHSAGEVITVNPETSLSNFFETKSGDYRFNAQQGKWEYRYWGVWESDDIQPVSNGRIHPEIKASLFGKNEQQGLNYFQELSSQGTLFGVRLFILGLPPVSAASSSIGTTVSSMQVGALLDGDGSSTNPYHWSGALVGVDINCQPKQWDGSSWSNSLPSSKLIGTGMANDPFRISEAVRGLVCDGSKVYNVFWNSNTKAWETSFTEVEIKPGQTLTDVVGSSPLARSCNSPTCNEIDNVWSQISYLLKDLSVSFQGKDWDPSAGWVLQSISGSSSVVLRDTSSATKVWPIDNPIITSCYGYRTLNNQQWHDGLDLDGVKGTPIKAVAAGKAIIVEANCAPGQNPCNSGYGNYIILEHADGTYTRYQHLDTVNINQNAPVTVGQQIGGMGNTGFSVSGSGGDGTHLHFEIYKTADFSEDIGKDSYDRDPLYYLPPLNLYKFPSSCKNSPTVVNLKAGGYNVIGP